MHIYIYIYIYNFSSTQEVWPIRVGRARRLKNPRSRESGPSPSPGELCPSKASICPGLAPEFLNVYFVLCVVLLARPNH